MEHNINVPIPHDWIEGIPSEEGTLQHIFRLGLYQYRLERALGLYRSGVGSLGFVAEQTGIPKQELIKAFRLRGVEPDFSEQTIVEETT